MTRRAAWWGLTVLAAVLVAGLWHLLLMKETLDRPLALAGGIALVWAAVAAARACERAAASDALAALGAPAARSVPVFWSRRSAEFWVVAALFSALLLLFDTGFQRAAGDGRGYFAQVHSIVIDRDLAFSNNIRSFAARPADAAFPLGTALLWTPFFAAAHAWLGLLNLFGAEHVRDGYWNPYQRAVGLGTFAYSFAAMVLLCAALRRFFDRAAVMLAAATILLATPVVWYAAVEASMSHGPSLFAVTVFLFAVVATRDRRRRRDWIAIGAAAVLMILVRPQNLLFVSVLGVEAVHLWWTTWRAQGAGASLRAAGAHVLTMALVAGVAAWTVLEPAAPGSAGGAVRAGSYMAGQELFSYWFVRDQLFSPLHGLISLSPVVAFALAGLALSWSRDWRLALGFLTAVAAQVILGASTPGWDGGASFGARRFVECALPFAFGLAAAIDLARRRPLAPIGAGLGVLVALNLTLVHEIRTGVITLSDHVPFERLTSALLSRIGNPFALPGAVLFSRRYGVPLGQYDRMPSSRYQNLHIDIGTEADEVFLVGGWYNRERNAQGAFRWATGPEAVVFTRLRTIYQYRLRFVAAAFTWPGAPEQTVQVRVNDVPVGAFPLDGHLRAHEMDLPDGLAREGYVRIAFRFGYARSPIELGLSKDTRRLAARFERVSIVVRDGN